MSPELWWQACVTAPGTFLYGCRHAYGCACMCVGMLAWVGECGGQRMSTHQESTSMAIYPSLTESRAHCTQDRPVSAPAPGIPGITGMCTTNNLQVGSRDLNSGPFVCMKKTLLTVSSPQPQEGVQCKQRCHLDATDWYFLPSHSCLFIFTGGTIWRLWLELVSRNAHWIPAYRILINVLWS